MNFNIGYQVTSDNLLIDSIINNKEYIDEVFFSWEGIANGRNSYAHISEISRMNQMEKTKKDFAEINEANIKLNLLLNGNCYGKHSQSRVFFNKIGEIVEYLTHEYSLGVITTASPLIAKFIKQNFSEIEVRASVNMEIGEIHGMDYLSEWFDGYYLKREYNRNFNKLKAARTWCDKNGKKLYGLANSGCLNDCSARTFHDNLVSHEEEIAEMDNAYDFEGQCWNYLKKAANRADWLKITNFIRPEDVPLYENFFDGIKLATRQNKNPAAIIRAYTRGAYSGSLPDLLEPDHAGLFYPEIIENANLPAEFGNRVLHCDKNCEECSFCREALKKATVILE